MVFSYTECVEDSWGYFFKPYALQRRIFVFALSMFSSYDFHRFSSILQLYFYSFGQSNLPARECKLQKLCIAASIA